MKLVSCSARSTCHSLPPIWRVATIARQARAVALIRLFGCGEKGMP